MKGVKEAHVDDYGTRAAGDENHAWVLAGHDAAGRDRINVIRDGGGGARGKEASV